MKEEIIFGVRAVTEAVLAGRSIERVLLKNGLSRDTGHELFRVIREFGIPFQFVPLERIDRITRKNHQGVVAFVSTVDYHFPEAILPGIYEKGEVPLFLVLDHITDVRNFGAIIRSAECAGVHAVIVHSSGTAPASDDAMKTSAGALNYVPLCRTDKMVETLDFLRESGLRIVAATEKADTLYTATEMNIPLAIIAGSEDKGISPALLEKADEHAKIPVLGKISSLNVSVAVSLMLYEALRQRMADQV